MQVIIKLIRKPATHVLLIALLGLLAYSGTFHAPFVLDDTSSITNNPLIKDLGNFISSPAGYAANPRRFIGYLSFAVNYRLCGLDVTCYHAVNIAIHITNALLIYLLVILTFNTVRLNGSFLSGSSRPIALFASALFVAHPVETEAVTYIVQRLTSLAVLFYLCALIFYIKARSRTGRAGPGRWAIAGYYLLSLVFALFAMSTKEISFTLPLVAALYELLFFEGRTRDRLLYLLPMLLMLFVIPVSMLHAHGSLGHLLSDINTATTASDLPRSYYLLTEFSVIVTYLRLLLLPVNQNLDYDYPISHSLFEPGASFSLLILLSLLGAAALLYKRTRKGGDPALLLAPFGIFWFFITLSVESSFIPIMDVIFEHRAYLPSIGIFITVSCLGTMAARKWFAASKAPVAVAVIVVLVLAAATYKRNNVWSSNIALWQDVVRKSPLKARPHTNLGIAYAAEGMLDEEIVQYKTALKLDPTDEYARTNLNYALEDKAKTEKAANDYYNLGLSLLNKGLAGKAVKELELARSLRPDDPDIHNNLGIAYAQEGMADKALEEFRCALRLKPDDKSIRANLEKAMTPFSVKTR
jgi:protein O-mannosyl-transferase